MIDWVGFRVKDGERSAVETDNKLKFLIYKAKDDEQSFEILLNMFENIIKVWVYPFKVEGNTVEDVLQEARIGFFKAVKDYKSTANIEFLDLVKSYVINEVVNLVINSVKGESKLFNGCLRFNSDIRLTSEGNLELGEGLCGGDLESIIERRSFRELANDIKFNSLEREVFNLVFVKGFDIDDVIEISGLSSDKLMSVFNSISHKIKQKHKKKKFKLII